MIWSKLQKNVESLMANSVKAHLQVHFTRYGSSGTLSMNRAWVTWDGKEITTFSTIRWLNARTSLASQLSGDNEPRVHYEYFAQAGELLEQRGIYPSERFLAALEKYASLSSEDALASSDVLIRAWSMFDKRLGKRRLRAMHLDQSAPEIERLWYQLRCNAEKIATPAMP
ncbi:MAG TPA: hypothetical protein VFV38_02410 [Ktedonobacteraceae bacterium]|nr:hypothetical protein [Ktedonobacteraceae bacterium]